MFERYIAYTKDNSQGYWFKRRIYGWGWTPARWQGWLVLAIYLGALWYIVKDIAVADMERDIFIFPTVPFIFITAILIIVCYAKGEKPKWQWGFPISNLL